LGTTFFLGKGIRLRFDFSFYFLHLVHRKPDWDRILHQLLKL
jgi:hypothetical protein